MSGVSDNGVFLPPSSTRLVTITAHVDHGKTTLADNLIEHNGIISERLAGTLRYLDSTPEEQRRGITMKSSAIGLRHRYYYPQKNKSGVGSGVTAAANAENIIVHLLDSPGHVDFSPEVSSSLQCCDGCLLVVDAVEGMCARTHQVVREAHSHQLVPVLVVNKIDRLCTHLCLTPTEAYLRLRNLLESVNAACAAMINSKRADRKDDDGNNHHNNTSKDKTINMNDDDDEESMRWTFEPSKGNVVFASALFGWGFSVPSLARSLFRHKTLPLKPMILKQYLWGDYKYRPDDQKMLKWKSNNNDAQQPLFAEFGLQPIWSIYEGISTAAVACGLGSTLFADGRSGVLVNGNRGNNKNNYKKAKIEASTEGMDQVLAALQQGMTAQSAASSTNNKVNLMDSIEKLQDVLTKTGSGSSEESALRAVLRRYRPLSDTVLDVVYEVCPSPVVAASEVRPRALALAEPSIQNHGMDGDHSDDNVSGGNNNDTIKEFESIKTAVRSCSVEPDAPTVAHICKFMVADRSSIRDTRAKSDEESSSSSTVMLGLARVLSGTLRTDSEYFVYGPKRKFSDPSTPRRSVRLFLLMGSSFVLVNEVPAGHLCAVQNLDDLQIKTATLCDSINGMPLRGFTDQGLRPLVKVNVETADPADTPDLERGLIKLSLADAAVEVTVTAKGERILACLGELHLEQSILDLKNIYCDKTNIDLQISEPIVEFGETTTWFRNDGDLALAAADNKKNRIEELDFASFFTLSAKAPPIRQLTIPPYNEEEGIEHVCRGRSRSVISGRVGAISLRVVPLESMLYQALKRDGTLTDECMEFVEELKHALGFPSDFSAESTFEWLQKSVISFDESGNAIASTQCLENGISVAGIQSVRNEVYIPSRERNEALKSTGAQQSAGNNDDDADNDGIGREEYEFVRSQIKNNGFISSNVSNEHLSQQQMLVLSLWKEQLKGSLVAGFQMAMRAGPICEEPVRGVMVVIEGLELALASSSTTSEDGAVQPESTSNLRIAKPLSGGMVAAAVRIGIRSALLSRPVRLVESHLKLTLHSSLAGLGPLYSILSRRRGKVLDDSMVDGTDLLEITAMLPHAESFGLAPELFRESSGEVTAPELVFSHWERLDQEHDPFWIPTSLEEREDFGELHTTGDVSTGLDNTALSYIRKVRKRKGLMVDSTRTVVAAEKQRTIKK